MQIARKFTVLNADPYAAIVFKTIDVEICHANPHEGFCVSGFEVPAQWSHAACEVLVRQMVRRNGVPAALRVVPEEGVPEWLWRSVPDEVAMAALPHDQRYGCEMSAKQIFHRLAGAWTYWGWVHDYFDTPADAKVFYDEWCVLLAQQWAAPASPQWLNAGLYWAYGIDGPAQGHFVVDSATGTVAKSKNAYARPQLHHCFIQGVEDSLVADGGIMNLWEREARIFKYGSATGSNMSSIRGEKESLSSGAHSAGLVRFLSVGDHAAGAIKPAGINKLADKLVVIDIDHPDIESVIRWKLEEEHKAAALISGARHIRRYLGDIADVLQQGDGENRFDPEHNRLLHQAIAQARRAMIPEAYIARVIDYARQGFNDISLPLYDGKSPFDLMLSIGGHQARLAVRMSDSFMQAARANKPWSLNARVDGAPMASLAAGTLMDEVAQAMWACADPAVQFSDSIHAWHGCAKGGAIEASSPRGEFLFLNDTACDIATVNLEKCVNDSGEFLCAEFEHVARLMVVMLDISVSMAQYPSRTIAQNTYRYRPLGLSYCNLSAMLMRMGYSYHSAEGRATAAAITALMTGAGYVASAELAKEQGAFEAFSENRESMMRMMWLHHEAAFGRSEHLGNAQVKPVALDHACIPDQALSDAVQRVWDLAMIRGDDYGYANAQISMVAASPVARALLDAHAPAIAPLDGLVQLRAAAGGTTQRQCVPALAAGLGVLGYSALAIDDIVAHVAGRNTLAGASAIDHASLKQKGFTHAQLERIEEMLPRVMQVREAFDPYVIGENFCREVLKLNDMQIHDANFDLLAYLGFSVADIEEANHFVCGAGNVKQAPHIREEDEAVFDSVSLAHGSNPQWVDSQIEMMAALSPFVSGGIAHEISISKQVHIEQCRAWCEQAWRKGLKSVSLTRAADDICAQAVVAEYRQSAQRDVMRLVVSDTPKAPSAEAVATKPMQREELPQRREGFTQKAIIGGQTIYLRTGEYADHRLGEIFIDTPKQPAAVRTLMQQCAIAVSVALQHGVPLEAFVAAFTRTQFDPAGKVEGSAHVETASSMLDYVFNELAANYLSKDTASVMSLEVNNA